MGAIEVKFLAAIGTITAMAFAAGYLCASFTLTGKQPRSINDAITMNSYRKQFGI